MLVLLARPPDKQKRRYNAEQTCFHSTGVTSHINLINRHSEQHGTWYLSQTVVHAYTNTMSQLLVHQSVIRQESAEKYIWWLKNCHTRITINTFCVHSPVKTFIWAPTRLSFDLRAHIPRTDFFATCSKTAMGVANLTKNDIMH